MKKYRISDHAVKRFSERFKNRIEDGLTFKSFSKLFYNAKQCKSLYNNTRFMTHIYETHGYDEQPEFRVFENLLFICKHKTVLTVINTDHSGFFSNQLFTKENKRYRK